MKTMRVVIAVLVTLLLSCNAERNEVVITGQFLGEHPEEIGYTLPVNGTSFEGFVNKVRLDSMGQFQISLHTDSPVLVHFLYFGLPALIVEPGNRYEIILTRNTDNTVEMSGDFSETQAIYSGFPHQHPMSCLYSYGEDFSSYESIRQKLNHDLQREISVLQELNRENKVSEALLNRLIADRKIYYYTAQQVLASRNHLDKKSRNEDVPGDIFSLWSEAAHGVSLDDPLLLGSYYSYDFLQMHLWYKIYTTFDYDDFVELRAEHRVNNMTQAHNIELAKEFLSDRNLEFYIAGTFFHQNMRRQYDNDLALLFDQFKRDYPESQYIPYVEKTLETMIEKQQQEMAAMK